ncbi:hypothetical protein L873DRAFT_1712053 [Choiromyces venosus 120613-1]|uniref:Uncharacterized protein n=1 Tax=Choiromyces venosus 120613-1 TaxID=1336337 RepID=A0A3N4J179_9PEZI|nr:hypothetical protein L873DRAFT_1712053 [Choiromyces venosus 120613-1]
MLFMAAFSFIFKPLIDLPSYITASINYAQSTRTAEASHSSNTLGDHLSASEKSTPGSGPDSDFEYKYPNNLQPSSHKYFPESLAIPPFHSATTKSVDRVGLAEDFEFTDLTFVTNPDTKFGSEQIQDSKFFGFPSQKNPFAIPFVSSLQSKLFTTTGTGAFSGSKRSSTAEGQLLRESLLSSAEKFPSSKATDSSALPSPIKPPYRPRSAKAAAFASPRSHLASTLCPQFSRSKLSSTPGNPNTDHPSNTSAPIAKQGPIEVTPVRGPFANFVELLPPLPSDQLYTTLPLPIPQQQSASRATQTPAPSIGMADATLNNSAKSAAITPKNIPWNRVYEIHTSQLRGHLRFLKLLAANKGQSQPLTQCISRAETLLKDATAAAAASGISTAGPVPAKPEKRRRSVRFEDEVAKEAKPVKKTKTIHKRVQRSKTRRSKPSEAQIAGLSSALGKRAREEPSDSSDSGDAADGEKVIKKIRKEYFSPGMVLEFESDDEDDEEFVTPSEEEGEEEEGINSDNNSDNDEDAEAGEPQDHSPSPEVDRKRTKDGGIDRKRTADKDIPTKRAAKEDGEDVPSESSKKRKILVLSAPKRTSSSPTREGEDAGRGKRVRPS